MHTLLIHIYKFKLLLTLFTFIILGRVAMLGLVALLTTSFVNQTPVLDVISTATGGVIF